jgi:uncharacterized membrane protein
MKFPAPFMKPRWPMNRPHAGWCQQEHIMTSITQPDFTPADLTQPDFTLSRRDRMILATGALAGGAILLAVILGTASGRIARVAPHDIWLTLHLLSVIPALPLGAFVLLRRKGDALHRLLGRTWGMLMMMAALSSFGLHGMTGSFSPIHLLSVLVIVMIPRGIVQAVRHNIAGHRRTMSLTYLGLAVAGLFTLLPGRLLGDLLFG